MDQLAGSVGDPGTLNRFAYANGSPIMLTDESGLASSSAQKQLLELADTSLEAGSFVAGIAGMKLIPDKYYLGDIATAYSAARGGYDSYKSVKDTKQNWKKRSPIENAISILDSSHKVLKTGASVTASIYLAEAPGAGAIADFAINRVPELTIGAGTLASNIAVKHNFGPLLNFKNYQKWNTENHTKEKWNKKLLSWKATKWIFEP